VSICCSIFFHAPANLFAFPPQLNHFAAQTFDLLLALFQLFAQVLGVALGRRPRFPRGFIQLDRAIDFLLQRLEIVRRNLRRYFFAIFTTMIALLPEKISNFSAVYRRTLWRDQQSETPLLVWGRLCGDDCVGTIVWGRVFDPSGRAKLG